MSHKGTRGFLVAAILFLYCFSLSICGEELTQTAFDYYRALPDSPSEEQVNKLCELFLAEAAWILPSARPQIEVEAVVGEYGDIAVKSIDPEVIKSEGKAKFEAGDVKYKGCHEYVYNPTLKALLLPYCYYSTALSLPVETVETRELRMTLLLKAIKLAGQEGSRNSDQLIRHAPCEYYRKLYDRIDKCGVLEEFDRISTEKSRTLDFGTGTNWEQLALWQKSIDNLTKNDAGVPYLSHWIWLKDHFGPQDIFLNPLPEVIPTDEINANCNLSSFLGHFVKPSFVSSDSFFEGYIVRHVSDLAKISLAGYYLFDAMLNSKDLYLKRYKLLRLICSPISSCFVVSVNTHSKIMRLLHNPDDPIIENIFNNRMDIWLYGEFSYKKISEGDAGRTIFCGMRQLEGKAHVKIEADRVIPLFFVVPGNAELSWSNYCFDLKDVRRPGTFMGSSRFFTWNHNTSVENYGWSQVDYHYPPNKINLELEYDFTPEGLQKIARSDEMRRYTTKIGRNLVSPEQFVESDFVPVVLYTFENCKYEIWQPLVRQIPYADMLLERPYTMIVVYPADDSIPIAAEPALLFKPLKYWFTRGWYTTINAAPYYMHEKYESPEFAPILANAQEISRQLGEGYTAKFREYLAKEKQRRLEDPQMMTADKQEPEKGQ